MAMELVKVEQKSNKGQGTVTTNTGTTTRTGSSTTTTAAREDSQTGKTAIVLQIEFVMKFRHASPTTPEGETEPVETC
jgi:hypothetical protein